MPDAEYSNREIDRMFSEIKEQLDRIEVQTRKTNGRVTKLERILMVSGTAVAAILAVKAPEIFSILKAII